MINPIIGYNNKHIAMVKNFDSEKSSGNLNFLDMLKLQFEKVNDMQLKADKSIEKMILNPQKTDINDIVYQLTKSELALYMTKSFVERAVRSYNDIINMK